MVLSTCLYQLDLLDLLDLLRLHTQHQLRPVLGLQSLSLSPLTTNYSISVSAQSPLDLGLGLKGLGIRVWGQGLTIFKNKQFNTYTKIIDDHRLSVTE